MSTRAQLLVFLQGALPGVTIHDAGDLLRIETTPESAPSLVVTLANDHGCEFATLVVEQASQNDGLLLRYFCCSLDDATCIEIETAIVSGLAPLSIADRVHAADWHEREAEDLYGIRFAGHPFLGDFVLHDTVWPEGIAPMRHEFDAGVRVGKPGKDENWRPRRVLTEEGAIVFPVGPIWSGYAESGLWLLETPGEYIHQAHSRLFHKYRAVEKIAEDSQPGEAVLLAERFSGSAAFAHAWAFCQALEKISSCNVPPRAEILRAAFAELERLRYHAASIAELADSTALAVGKAIAQEIEEKLLRLAGEVCGHRYFFGLCVPGGLAWDPGDEALMRMRSGVKAIAVETADLERTLAHTSSFLDRIEEMGILPHDEADVYGVVGPVARASGRMLDLRHNLPYGIYTEKSVSVPSEEEGDGYARLRVFFAEMRASTTLIDSLLTEVPEGTIMTDCPAAGGSALAWVEAPAGAAFHWLRTDEYGRVARWCIAPPSFRNWHAFDHAFAGAAFQDFHIIMASFGLSVAESDR